jgi:exonuclease VII small subunit
MTASIAAVSSLRPGGRNRFLTGVKSLKKRCEALLADAEMRVEKITRDAKGRIASEPLDRK